MFPKQTDTRYLHPTKEGTLYRRVNDTWVPGWYLLKEGYLHIFENNEVNYLYNLLAIA
jgi:hypothetical protein